MTKFALALVIVAAALRIVDPGAPPATETEVTE